MDKMFSASAALLAVGALAFTSAGASSTLQQCALDLAARPAALVDTAMPVRSASLGPATLSPSTSGAGAAGADEEQTGIELADGVPASVDLQPIPARYADGYAIYERYRYAVVGDDAFIVDPTTRQIIAKLR